MKIKRAELSDLDQLSLLFDAYRIFYKKDSDIDAARRFLGDRIGANESVIFLADDGSGACAGFVQLYPLFSSTRMCRLWLLNDLYVDPNHRGKGVANLLISAAKELAQNTGASGIMLETAKDNHIGNALYPREGFALDVDHNFYFWENA